MLYIGDLVNTHGIKGEVRIISNFKYKSTIFKPSNILYINGEKLKIKAYRKHKNYDMSQSLSKNYIHLIFSTKYREAQMKKEDFPDIYAYISGILTNLDCPLITIGGTSNHLHILCVLNKNIALSKMVEEIKKSTSRWIKGKGSFYRQFAWQDGYGAFSVSQSKVETVSQYIRNQETHHATRTFEEELRIFLNEYKVEYNENYL